MPFKCNSSKYKNITLCFFAKKKKIINTYKYLSSKIEIGEWEKKTMHTSIMCNLLHDINASVSWMCHRQKCMHLFSTLIVFNLLLFRQNFLVKIWNRIFESIGKSLLDIYRQWCLNFGYEMKCDWSVLISHSTLKVINATSTIQRLMTAIFGKFEVSQKSSQITINVIGRSKSFGANDENWANLIKLSINELMILLFKVYNTWHC